ncbi:MAG TPA: S8 family serine peptidase [Gaiellaceae bacterium]|nr:S8 family serine peptidase [Gaiellaceae bacterium]
MKRSVRIVALVAVVAGALAAVGPAAAGTYVLLYKQEATPADVGVRVAMAGGTLVARYDAIGVAIAESDSSTFTQAVGNDARLAAVAASTAIARLNPLDARLAEAPPGDLPNAPATPDSLASLQWDMRQIHAFEAHEITGGSPAVVVGDIDTGLDKDHPDLVQNIDFARSVSCETGAPNTDPAAWDDHNGHGTHTAGTIAAADNGFGITGVAPNVKVAGIKSSNDDGYFFAHMVVCSFMWAGSQHLDVTNNSYFMDPYLYNCRSSAEQRVLWQAAKRAVSYAQRQGVTVVASAGNQADDLAHPTIDVISPDYPPGSEEEREITNACVVVPVELPGVVAVSAVGNTVQVDGDDDATDYLKSYYSSFGVGVVDVTAPGGDFYYGRGTDGGPFGLVLSTWPAEIGGSRRVFEGAAVYRYLQGTSMASPHAAGVAALIVSRFGDGSTPQNGTLRPGQVIAILQGTADAQPCPTELPLSGAPGSALEGVPYAEITRPDGSLQECQGGAGSNSWYGSGQVNALRAVTHDMGN